MSLTPSKMIPLESSIPSFELPDFKGQKYRSKDFTSSQLLLVAFICNHCPYVKHIIDSLTNLVDDYTENQLATIAINSNDVETYPQDSPEKMQEFAEKHKFKFPYLYDETQEVAASFGAACTPDFFLFDNKRKLVYRGRFDGSMPGSDHPVTGKDLKQAIDAALAGKDIVQEQKPSMGCNIKWTA